MSDSDDDVVDKQLKLVFLGEPTVGKTSIIRRFCYDDFTRHYHQTIGAEFHINRLKLPGKQEVTVRITDIGGLEMNGRNMLNNYLFNADIIVLVYDITNIPSFDGLIIWIDIIRRILGNEIKIAVFANKNDLEHKRAVRLDKTQEFVNEYQLINYLVSARTGTNVNSTLNELIVRHFGLPLNKIEREKQKGDVKSEISPSSPEKPKKLNTAQTNSSVCCIQ